MRRVESPLIGRIDFEEAEEFVRLRKRFLSALLILSVFFSAFRILLNELGIDRLDAGQDVVLALHATTSAALRVASRGSVRRLLWISWAFVLMSLVAAGVTLTVHSGDDIRVVWFHIHLAAAYLLLGPNAGAAVAVVSVATIVGVDLGFGPILSASSMATLLFSFVALAVTMHIFTERLITYFIHTTTLNRELATLARRDPLTGLLNSRAYRDLCEALPKGAANEGRGAAVMFIDLDRFKSINDTHGHDVGDEVLRQAATRISASVRCVDPVARIGGEEFSVFLSDTKPDEAFEAAERVRRDLEALNPSVGGLVLPVTASVGVASIVGGEWNFDELQRRADLAMYRAKREGRNRVVAVRLPESPIARVG